ncbi:MAG: chemotaxis response regulator protein-glutamate methylesterase [Candidatus Gastranaerophilaceae bacterium]|jgi:two-component system chemotaxis response regulator CheB
MITSDKKIQVLIVDDSALIRNVLADILNAHPNIKVIGQAMNGRMAINLIKVMKPDVITLDVEMPFMNGLETLQEIKKIRHIPTIMLSNLTARGADVTIQALELGAVDFMQKPTNPTEIEKLAKELIDKILSAARNCNTNEKLTNIQEQQTVVPVSKVSNKTTRVKTVVIGTSTGGPQSLKEVIPYIPEDLPAQILIVQHMPAAFTPLFAERLSKMSKIEVKEAKEGDILEVKKALLAPGNFHMLPTQANKIKLNQDPPLWGVRPAVDMTLAFAAQVYKEDLICVIMTGMGRDGSQGAGVVKKFGGYVIAQDEATSIIYGMPKCVIDAGFADEIVPLPLIAQAIVNAVYR